MSLQPIRNCAFKVIKQNEFRVLGNAASHIISANYSKNISTVNIFQTEFNFHGERLPYSDILDIILNENADHIIIQLTKYDALKKQPNFGHFLNVFFASYNVQYILQ